MLSPSPLLVYHLDTSYTNTVGIKNINAKTNDTGIVSTE